GVLLRVVGAVGGADQNECGRPRGPPGIPAGERTHERVEGVVPALADDEPHRLEPSPGRRPAAGVDDRLEVVDGDRGAGVVAPCAPAGFDQLMHTPRVEGAASADYLGS